MQNSDYFLAGGDNLDEYIEPLTPWERVFGFFIVFSMAIVVMLVVGGVSYTIWELIT